ncbi:MAG: polysulfide reductase NrfD [Betaproteobacteria bacterium]|nr:polysulfide reductase NrfD [Betaproteobacteria bacterium]
MAQKFTVELKRQHEWGWLLSLWLFLSGAASALFLLYEMFSLPALFAQLALGIIVAGGIVLLLELGSPKRAWRGVSKLGTSWLSRGALSVGLFVVCAFLFLAPAFPAFAWLPWGAASGFAKVLEWVAGLCALVIVFYPGIFLSQNRSIPFWNTPWLVAVMVVNAWLLASAVVLLGASALKDGSRVIDLLPWAIVAAAVLSAIYLAAMNSAGGAARESVRLLTRGPVALAFWIGAVAVGMLVPLALLWAKSGAGLAAVCLLAGGFLFRYCVLSVGVFVPSTVVQEGLDFSKLNRTSTALLAQEYAGMASNAARRG